jgi:hypothetical protein
MLIQYPQAAHCSVTVEEYYDFRRKFFHGRFHYSLRYGQAFYIHFYEQQKICNNLPWPELFFEIDITEAERRIMADILIYQNNKKETTNDLSIS